LISSYRSITFPALLGIFLTCGNPYQLTSTKGHETVKIEHCSSVGLVSFRRNIINLHKVVDVVVPPKRDVVERWLTETMTELSSSIYPP
jgi:hypothetical protein